MPRCTRSCCLYAGIVHVQCYCGWCVETSYVNTFSGKYIKEICHSYEAQHLSGAHRICQVVSKRMESLFGGNWQTAHKLETNARCQFLKYAILTRHNTYLGHTGLPGRFKEWKACLVEIGQTAHKLETNARANFPWQRTWHINVWENGGRNMPTLIFCGSLWLSGTILRQIQAPR